MFGSVCMETAHAHSRHNYYYTLCTGECVTSIHLLCKGCVIATLVHKRQHTITNNIHSACSSAVTFTFTIGHVL